MLAIFAGDGLRVRAFFLRHPVQGCARNFFLGRSKGARDFFEGRSKGARPAPGKITRTLGPDLEKNVRTLSDHGKKDCAVFRSAAGRWLNPQDAQQLNATCWTGPRLDPPSMAVWP